jgi:YihY family inner membrane protein
VDLLRPVRAFDRFQQRHRLLAFPVAVLKKSSDDEAGSLAALITYYAFFSLFPLLLVFVTVLGFVLHGDPNAQRSVVNSTVGQIPVIGQDIRANSLHGSTTALVIGIAGALWGALGVTQAAQRAFDKIWAVPIKDRPNFFQSRIRGFALLTTLGLLNLIASIVSGIVIGGLGGPLVKVAGTAISLTLDLVLFLAAFRLLTAPSIATRCLVPGAVMAAVLWQILQIAGGYYVAHVLKHASATYGTFAVVIGMLSWLYLGARATIYAAEINVVRARRLWPRSLLEPLMPGDEETLRALAKVEERTDREQIDVRFRPPETGPS